MFRNLPLPARTATVRQEFQELLVVSLPILTSNLTTSLLGLVDTAMMGHYSVAGVAAVATGASLYAVLSNILMAAGMAHAVHAARRFGAGDAAGVGRSFSNTLVFAGLVSLVLVLVSYLVGPHVVRFFTHESGVQHDALQFLLIRSLALPFVMLGALFRMTFNANRETRLGMNAVFLVNTVNLLIGFPLVYGWGVFPEWGVTGSALGSLAADLSGTLFLGWLFYRKNYPQKIELKAARVGREELQAVRKVSGPSMLSSGMDYFSNLLLFVVMGALSTTHLAGGRIAFNVLLYLFMITSSLAAATQILCGRALGAREFGKLKGYHRRNQQLMLLLLGWLGVLLVLAPHMLVGIFTSFPDVQAATTVSMQLIGLSIPFMVWSSNNTALLRAHGKTSWDMYANLIGVWGLQLPISWYLATRLEWGLSGIFTGFALYWVLRAGITFWFVHRLEREGQA